MKKLLVMLLACLLLAACTAKTEAPAETALAPTEAPAEPASEAAAAPEASATGYEGPAFSAQTLGGESLDESYIQGNKLTLVNFWATWCPPCVGEMPDLAKLHTAYADKGFGILGVMLDDDLDAAQTLITNGGIGYPLIPLPDAFAAMTADMQYVPTTLFFDASGKQVGEPVVGALGYDDWAALVDGYLAALS